MGQNQQDTDLDALEIKTLKGDYPDWDVVLSLIDELRDLKKGKKMSTNLPKSMGRYEYERATARFYVFVKMNEKGVKESQYVYKDHFAGEKPPRELEFFIKW